MEKLNVAIADDNERMLNLLGEIVESDKDLKLVGKARNGEDIYHIIRDKQPDVVLLDLIMPKMDGTYYNLLYSANTSKWCRRNLTRFAYFNLFSDFPACFRTG